VAGQPGSVAGFRAKMTRGAHGARRQCCRRRVLARSGMQDIGSSPGFNQWIRLFFLYMMVCSKTRFENFDF